MPFSLELRNDEVLKVLSHISSCSILPLEFGSDGLHVDVGTDAKSAAYSVYFPSSYFDNYEFLGDESEIYAIGNTNFTNMLKMLATVPYPILMESTLDGVIKISNIDAGKHFRVKCLEGEYKEYMIRIRNKFSSVLRESNAVIANVDTVEFKKALKDLSVVSPNVVLSISDNTLEMSADGIEMEGNIILKLNNRVSAEWNDKYSADLLYTGMSLYNVIDYVMLYLGSTITITADKDNWYCRYVAAPQRR